MKRIGNGLLVLIVAAAVALGGPGLGHSPNGGLHGALVASAAPLKTSSVLRRQVLGFVNDYNLGDPSVGYQSWNFTLLTTVVYFGLQVNSGDGWLVQSNLGWSVFHSSTFSAMVNAAHASGTRVLVSLDLHDFSLAPDNQTCQGLQPSNAANTIRQIAAEVANAHIDGVNIDYEGTDTLCADGQSNRAELDNFAQNLRAAMPSAYLVIDTFSGSAEDNLEFFDLTGLQPSVNAFFVMAYDMDMANYSYPPLNCSSYCTNPVSPLNTYRFNVTNSMSQYMNYAPSSKIILGQPLYGRRGCVGDLTTAHQPATYVSTPTYLIAASHASNGTVSSLSAHRDPGDGVSEWDTWNDTIPACPREQYWDDVVSLGAKYDLVNHDDLGGVGFFTLDYGGGAPELWSALATHFTLIPGMPGNLSACAGNASAAVSWTAAPTAGGPITTYKVTANPGGISVSVPGTATFATVGGLTPGTAYSFTVVGINSSGQGVGAMTPTVTPVATAPAATTYVNWYDRASPGMVGDNIHILNPGASTSSGCVTLSGAAVVPWTAGAGQETYVALPAGTIGGPVTVTVNTGPAVRASQRVQYYQSFNEVWTANAAQPVTTGYFNWFDKASPGMLNDNIHLLNPGTSSAAVTVSLPGASSQVTTVAAGAEAYVSFPAGTIGGPVTVSSTQPVLASQRVQYNQSFNEVWASSAAQAATTSYFNWFDRATPGMLNDNIHLLNPGGASATVTVSLPGATPQVATVAAGADAYVTFPAGKIGGPVTVSSTQPVLASQRVQFNQSFNEVWASRAGQAVTTSYFNWFDRASIGMVNDNIHLFNPGGTSATVTVSLPGATSQIATVAAGAETYVTFPAGTIGGPVTVNATQPVVASQRVQYYQSFNEIPAA